MPHALHPRSGHHHLILSAVALLTITLFAACAAPPAPAETPEPASPAAATAVPTGEPTLPPTPTATSTPPPTATPGPGLEELLGTPVAYYTEALLEESAAAYEELAALYPGRAEPLLGLAAIAGRQADFDAALAYVRRAVEADPTSAEALRQLAVMLDQRGEHAELADVYGQMITLNAADPNLYIARGMAYARLGRAAEAIADLRAAEALDPYRQYAWLNAAAAASSVRAYEAAAQIAAAGLEAHPDSAGLLLERGLALLSLGDAEAALVAFNTALTIDENSTQAHFWRGRALAALGQPGEALGAFQTAGELGVRSGITTYTLGLEAMAEAADILARSDPGAAFSYLADRVFEHGSRDPLLMGYARVDWRRGNVQAAIDRLEGLGRAGYVPAYYWRGVMLVEQGRTADALPNLRTFVELRGYGPDVEEALRLIESAGG